MGVFYGAAMTAAREMEDQDVFVVGGGNSAGQAAVHLARYARSVTILVRRPDLAETMSSYLIGEIEYNRRISVRDLLRRRRRWRRRPPGLAGPRGRAHRRAGEGPGLRPVPAARRRAALRLDPACVARDEHGFVLTGRDVPRELWSDGLPPENLATTVPGSSPPATCGRGR